MSFTDELIATLDERIAAAEAEIAALRAALGALRGAGSRERAGTRGRPPATPAAPAPRRPRGRPPVARPATPAPPAARPATPAPTPAPAAEHHPPSDPELATVTRPQGAVAAPAPGPAVAPAPPRPPREDAPGAEPVEAMLAESPHGASAIALAKRTGIGYNRVIELLRGLEAAGTVRRSGTRRTSLWRLVSDEERIAERTAELERLAGPGADGP
jgi:hypothetical protein